MKFPSQSITSIILTLGMAVLAYGGWVTKAESQKGVELTPVLTTETAALKWKDVDVLPPGAKAAVLAKAGDWQVTRVKFPAHYVVPPHSHSNAEAIWVVGGKVGFGFGQNVDMSGPMLGPGAFFAQPGGTFHYVWTGDEAAVIDVQVTEPETMMFAHPADDPRARKK
jgi:quercetin dioxygenase-like cupin family protein